MVCKFLVPLDLLPEVVDALAEHYYYGIKDDEPVQNYRTVYYDTEDYYFFNQHRRGKFNRLKLRVRHYQDGSPMAFVEAKQKLKGRHTRKERKPIINPENAMEEWFLQKYLYEHNLSPSDLLNQTEVEYKRIAFIAKDFLSRASIDLEITAKHNDSEYIQLVPDHCVLEIKDKKFPKAVIKLLQSQFKIRQTSFSKYCIALCMLNSELKDNKWRHLIKRYCAA